MKTRTFALIGILALICAIRTPLMAQEAIPYPRQSDDGDIPNATTLWWNVVYVGRDVIDLQWYPELGDQGYKITRDGHLIAELGTDATFYRDSDPLPGAHTYTLYRTTDSGDNIDGTDSVTLGSVGGQLYEDLTWTDGVYTIATNVEVMPGVTLSIQPGVEVSAKTQTFHPHGLFGEGVLAIDGAVLDIEDLWIQGNGTVIENSDILPGSIQVEADAQLRRNLLGTISLDVTDAASLSLTGNHFAGGISFSRTTDQATLIMERNVIDHAWGSSGVLALGSSGTAVLTDNRFEGCPDQNGALQVNGSGAVTIRDNTFRCAASNRYSAVGVLVTANNPGIIERNVFEGPYRYGSDDDASAIQVNAGAGIAIQDNLFREWPVAVRSTGGAPAITHNTFVNNGLFNAIVVDGDGDTVLRTNCILNGIQIDNRTTSLDAQLNWWGDPSGPYHDTNPDGLGWTIYGGPVTFDPWLTDEADAPCNVVDLTLAGVEVVQSTQSLANGVPLVAEKPGVLRIYADSAAGSVSGAPVVVKAYRDSVLLGLRAVLADAVPISDVDAIRDEPTGGTTIEMPTAWLSGTVTLVTEINPDHTINEIRYDNNTLTQTVTFERRRPLRLAYVPMTYHPEGSPATGPVTASVPILHKGMASLYPIPGIDYEVWSPLTWPLQMKGASNETERGDLVIGLLTLKLAIVNAGRADDAQMDQIFGYFPGGAIKFCYSDPVWDGGRGVASYCATGGMWMAHEIGHNLGLRHPNTPDSGAEDNDTYWPYEDSQIREAGYDVTKDAVKPSRYLDFMGYSDASIQWTGPLHYNMLFNTLPEPATETMAVKTTETTYLIVSGQTTTADAVTFQPFWQVTSSSPPANPPAGTEYCIEMRNGTGAVLQSRCFDLSFYNHETNTSTTTDFFLVSLPLDPAAASVVLARNGIDTGTAEVSAHAPQVTLVSPNGGESLGRTVTVAWTAEDQDGDALAYTVLYSADGDVWDPLALNITGTTSIDLDLSFVPGGNTGRFRVEASDGYHTAFDESDGTVTVGNHPPLTTILTPTEGFSTTGTLVLQGAAYDAEDGPLTGVSLTWTSDRDGVLGTGESLEAVALSGGAHTLTLRATDQAGSSTEVHVNVTVDTPVSGLRATSDSPTQLGETTTFTASVTGGTDVAYTWTFGDGASGSGATATHTYTATGTLTATVTASNRLNQAVISIPVTITDAPGSTVYLPMVLRP